ncbi:cortical protein marker for cell polarity-domain-containing protein [Mycotypha africana]|uniref:cortical protein marker for cell polarity-domain-containing protein n=1 Tax=Mycotypha africana TaxID=64632 RepID=UPI002301B922|nr:cortical protein marker for cell polarity-domain-containing protein [Mycotypha africana]KAI8988035.1 cortical protein marker for cell polarity-domain-containing protein [Mycotypha africana]
MLKVLHVRLVLLLLTTAINFSRATYVTHPEINFNPIKALGIAGSYSGISLYKDTEQLTQIEKSTSSVISLTANDTLKLIASSNINGEIFDTCVLSDSTLYIAGKFSTISGHTVNNIASIDLSNYNIKSLQYGLDGPVYSLYCDSDHQAVYAGGSFRAPISSSMVHYTDSLAKYGGSIAVWKNNEWNALPWKGMNGPVYSILKKSTDSILFGGKFDITTDGQMYHAPASHPIALSADYVTANSTASNSAVPGTIVCADAFNKKPWILADGTRGTMEITFVEYNVNPSLIRIANSKLDNHKTKEFSVRSLTDSSVIYEFTYLDPDTNLVKKCSTNCILSANPTVDYQDFVITNLSMTSGIAIDVKSWYGVSGGLASVKVFQSEIFTYAVDPQKGNTCVANSSNNNMTLPKVTLHGGRWDAVTDGIPYLSAKVDASALSSSPSVTFYPNLQESGIYEVLVYNPSCSTAGCSDRTDVDVIISTSQTQTVNSSLSQKITGGASVYTGYFDVDSATTTDNTSTAFRPNVKLTLAHNASFTSSSPSKNLVAYAVQFIKYATAPALANILEYNSSVTNITSTAVPWGPLKDNVPYHATVKAMALVNNNIYIGGNFSGTDTINGSYSNILRYDLSTNLVKALPQGGVNGMVETIIGAGNDVYVGGAFSALSLSAQTFSKRQNPSTATNYFANMAKYDTHTSSWSPLRAGVNGPVKSLSLINNGLNQRLLISGEFSEILKTNEEKYSSRSNGHAFWDMQNQNWNATDMPYLSGITYGSFNYKGSSYFIGNIKAAQRYSSHGISFITSPQEEEETNSATALQLPTLLNFNPTDNGIATVSCGAIYRNSTATSRTMAVLAGKFTLPDNNIKNVAIYDNGIWSGVDGADDWEGAIHSSVVSGDYLYVGGRFSGSKASNLAIFQLPTGTLSLSPEVIASDHSPATVNIIRHDPIQNLIVVGGNFSSIGSISCASICSFDTKKLQWSSLGSGLSGEVNDVQFVNNKLVASGNLTLNTSPLLIAEYDFQKNTWGPFSTADLPGPSRLLAFDNVTQSLYITGKEDKTGATYFRTWNGHQFIKPEQELGPQSVINSLSILPLVNTSDISSSSNSNDDNGNNSKGILLASGYLNLGSFGYVSAAFYNGTAWVPYLVTSNADGSIDGSLSSLFHMPLPVILNENKGYLPKPLVILVAIAISLGIVFLIVLLAMLILFFKRKRDAKVNPQMNPATYYNKPPMSPDSLLATLKQNDVIHENINFNENGDRNNGYYFGTAEKQGSNPFRENENLYHLSRTISREFLNNSSTKAVATTTTVAASAVAKKSNEYPSTHYKQGIQEKNTMLLNDEQANGHEALQSDSNNNTAMDAVAGIKKMSEMPKRHSPFNPFRNLAFDSTGAAIAATNNNDNDSNDPSLQPAPQQGSDIRWKTTNVGSPIETAYVPERLVEPASAFVTSRSMTLDNNEKTINRDKNNNDTVTPIPNTTIASTEKDTIVSTSLPTNRDNAGETALTTPAAAMGTNALDGRAASKRMVEEYFSKRPIKATTASSDSKRDKHKSDFKAMMDSALINNTQTTTATEDHPHLYYAKFDFKAREEGELGFKKSDPIIVTDSSDDIWWMGYKADKTDGSCVQGVFPSNYVEKATNIR